MNQKAPYELTITEKLGQLQVPDMRDAIWSRIETQLDLDMPEQNDGPEDPNGPDAGKWKATAWKLGPIAVLVAVITIFFIQQKSKKQTHSTTPSTEQTTTPNPANNNGPPPGNKQQPGPLQPNHIPVNRNDSAFTTPVKPILADTTAGVHVRLKDPEPQLQHQVQAPPAVSQQKTDSTVKKSRGVKGISDKDYHITLKKDSIP